MIDDRIPRQVGAENVVETSLSAQPFRPSLESCCDRFADLRVLSINQHRETSDSRSLARNEKLVPSISIVGGCRGGLVYGISTIYRSSGGVGVALGIGIGVGASPWVASAAPPASGSG